MSWVRLDDLLPHHRKLMGCGYLAPVILGYYTASIAFANRHFTDGVIRPEDLPLLIPATPRPSRKVVALIVSTGFWDVRPEGGWQIHDFLEHNASAAERRAKLAADAARKARAAANGNRERGLIPHGIHAESRRNPNGIHADSARIPPVDPLLSSPLRSNSTPKRTTRTPQTPQGARSPEGFDRFWSAYPKKVGKDAARRAWIAKACDPHVTDILAALVRQHDYLHRDGGKYIPNPATWLNEGRWQDDPPMDTVHAKTKANTAGVAEWLRQQQKGR